MNDATRSSRVPRPRHTPALDGLRGCAILLVMLLHLSLREPVFRTAAVRAIQNAFTLGWSGVDLFFVLSGFLITGLLFDAKGQRGYFKTFYARRALRILPLYYGALLAVFLLPYLLGARVGVADLTPPGDQLWYWAYLQNFHAAKGVPGEFLNPFWTLAIEEQFYLFWPLVIFLGNRKQALWICLGCIVAAIGYRSVMISLGYSPDYFGPLTPARIDSLAVGSGLALLARSSDGLALLRRVSPYAIASGILVLAVAFLRSGSGYHHDVLLQTVGFTALALMYAGALVRAVTGTGVYARILQSRLLRFFGRYSYGLYVIHLPVMILFAKAGVVPDRFLGIDSPGLALLSYMAMMMAVCVGCAWLSWHLFEKRFLLLKRHFVYDAPMRTAMGDPVTV